ncbi:MAG: helix-turn-helix domain-containing protein, partial [Actinomycetota bacterium]
MTTLLTTQEVQDLLHVDRSTVYRMADDGRLPSVKVGRQWRFPADRIAAQFGTPVPSDTGVEASIAPRAAGERPALSRNDRSGRDEASPLAPDAAQAIANLLADLLGVMTLVSDAHGNPLSDVTNPCGLYAAIAGEQAAADACVAEWRSFAERPQVAQRFSPTHLGFLCARAFVWADGRPVAMLLVGGITPPVWPPPPDRVE